MLLMKRISISVPEEVHQAWKEESEHSGIPMAEIVRRLLDAYLKTKGGL